MPVVLLFLEMIQHGEDIGTVFRHVNVKPHFPDHSLRINQERILRGESFAIPRLRIESYDFETSLWVSASSLKFSPSLAQNCLCEFSSCTLTPRITALRFWYSDRSR